MSKTLGHSSTGKTVEWGPLRTECWREYFGPRGRSLQKYGENSVRTRSMVCSLQQISLKWSNRLGGGDIYAAYVGKKEELRILCVIVAGKEKGMRQLGKYGGIGVYERIIWKWTLKKQDVAVYWIHMLGIGWSSEPLLRINEPQKSIKHGQFLHQRNNKALWDGVCFSEITDYLHWKHLVQPSNVNGVFAC